MGVSLCDRHAESHRCDGGRFCELEEQYQRSYLSHLYPGLDLGREAMAEFLAVLGSLRSDMVQYMEYMRDGEEHVALVGGLRGMYASEDNLVYLFANAEGSIGMPAFYQWYPGGTKDREALEELVRESGLALADITLIGDEGCIGAEGTETAEKSGANFVLGIQRGTYGLPEKIPAIYEYQGAFAYHSRGISYFSYECEDRKSRIIVYFDCDLFAHEASSKIAERALASGKDVTKAQRDLERRRKELAKAEQGVERAQSAVAEAESRVTLTSGDLLVAQRKREEAEAQVAVKTLSLDGKREKCKAAKTGSQREYAAGVAARAEASEAKANAEMARAEAAYHRKDLQLLEEQRKLRAARESLEMAMVRLRRRQESVQAGERRLAVVKADYDEAAAIPAATSARKDSAITRETGTFALKTNRMDLSAEEVYLLYRQRPAIEAFFQIYDKILRFDASYMMNISSAEAWLFLNHLSATMAVLALRDSTDSGQPQPKGVSCSGRMDPSD